MDASSSPPPPPLLDALDRCEYLVFSGAGARGIALCSALVSACEVYHALRGESLLKKLRGAAGTSIGAALALACVCGADPRRVGALLIHTDAWSGAALVRQMDLGRLLRERGLCPHAMLRGAIDQLLALLNLPRDIDFCALHRRTGRVFMCNATRVADCSTLVMSHDSTPYLRVRDALLMSACVPGLFPPVRYRGAEYVDGGVPLNYAPHWFPRGSTLGIAIDNDLSPPPPPRQVVTDDAETGLGALLYFPTLIGALCARLEAVHLATLDPVYRRDTLRVYTPGVEANTFSCSTHEARALWQHGQRSALWFLLKERFVACLVLASAYRHAAAPAV